MFQWPLMPFYSIEFTYQTTTTFLFFPIVLWIIKDGALSFEFGANSTVLELSEWAVDVFRIDKRTKTELWNKTFE